MACAARDHRAMLPAMAHHEISRGQLRGLLLLLVLGPLIPTVLLLRYMTDSVRAERADYREQIRQIYQQSLTSAVSSLQTQWATKTPTRAEAPRRILDYLHSALDPRAAIVLRDESGRVLSPGASPAGAALAKTAIGPPFEGWTAALFLADLHAMNEEGGDATSIVVWTVAAALAANLLIAGSAAFAVFRQLKIHELRSSTLAMVSHELKTPLASMRVLLETLREGRYRTPEQLAEYLELLTRERDRLSRTIENFLTLSRVERGIYALESQKIDPNELARAAVAARETALEGAVVECRCAADLPVIAGDREALLMVLENLLDNARKYTGPEKRIALATARDGDRVCFVVEDNGIGIAPSEQKRIFGRFYQVDQTLARRTEGCGLGLSIVKQIVQAHGGEICVESTPGAGSRFTVSLRCA